MTSCVAGRVAAHLHNLTKNVKDICQEFKIELDEDEEEIEALTSYYKGGNPVEHDRAAYNMYLLDLNVMRLQQAEAKVEHTDNEPDGEQPAEVNLVTMARVAKANSDAQQERLAILKLEALSTMDDIELHDGHWDHLRDFNVFVSGLGRGPNRRLPCPKWCYHCR
eukprot:1681129-Rhodomonas_salina.1